MQTTKRFPLHSGWYKASQIAMDYDSCWYPSCFHASQVQSARGVEAAVQAQLASLQQQLSEANEVIETTRLERSKLQDIKWRLEDRVSWGFFGGLEGRLGFRAKCTGFGSAPLCKMASVAWRKDSDPACLLHV